MKKRKMSVKGELASYALYGRSGGKKEEQLDLSSLLERLGIGKYKLEPSESPDFVIHLRNAGSRLDVACEVTRLLADTGRQGRQMGSPQKRALELWRIIAKTLRLELDNAGYQHLVGALFLKGPARDVLPRVRRDRLVKELVELCRDRHGRAGQLSFPIARYSLLSEVCDHVGLWDYGEEGLLWWCSDLRVGTIPDPADAIVDCVRKKSAVADGNQWMKSGHIWLVIVAEGTVPASVVPQLRADEIRAKMSPHPFTWIVLWDKFSENVFQIHPTVLRLCDSDKQRRHLVLYPSELGPFIVSDGMYPVRNRDS